MKISKFLEKIEVEGGIEPAFRSYGLSFDDLTDKKLTDDVRLEANEILEEYLEASDALEEILARLEQISEEDSMEEED